MTTSELLFEKEDGIAILTLNRPDKFNALTTELVQEIRRITEELHRDESTKVLILTGAGRGFCSGADVARRLAPGGAAAAEEKKRWEVISSLGAEFLPLARLPKPTIAAINGVVAGVGNTLALACDIRIAAESARFTTAWVKIGLIPDGGCTYYLPRILGLPKALELMFTGDMVNAAEAERIGLVNKVVPDADLMSVTKEFAGRIAKGPSLAIELMKIGARRALEHDIESQLDYEGWAQNICRNSQDHQEGIKAFMEKREAKFEGR